MSLLHQHLHELRLMRDQAAIDGQWIAADNGATFAVSNPADGSVIAQVSDLGQAETARAIEAANRAFPAWRSRTAKERSRILRRWFELITAHQEDLAVLMTLEQGKPLAESRGEIAYGAAFVEWFAEEAKRIEGDIIPATVPGRRLFALKEPIGVTAAITPWNFPIAMITRKVAPALAAGCTSVVKPSKLTPLSALALAELANEAGVPAGVLNIVPSAAAATVGHELCTNPIVRKISVTGSTEIGRLVMRLSADTVKRLSLELGGNAPFIVFDDADLDAAVAGALACKYRNSGQTCVCANRILVQDAVYDAFAAKLGEAVAALKVGPGLEAGVQQGPLINAAAVAKVEEHIEDAVSAGATVITGGRRHTRGGTFFEPTVLADVTPKMKIAKEETFGPVAPLFRFQAEEEAIAMANATEFGLAAYLYARDVGRIWRVAEALEYGMVGVNEGIISTEVAPFGGVKQSGIGREGSRYGIDEYLEIKYVCLGGL
ncbi:MAG: NAD-dependent succinate-semialdehyde dehydrogenase [Defluviicoccus sp.]|nr:NAD-dependent succinate-semialdehyde dehydrogenase [Defluviicoccus sp.]MDG4593261.1 NAD-dependent succinate-semialdehyde dehydrogenase [Defluviicoccus sp.]